MSKRSFPPLVVRWLGAYGSGPSLEDALRWEMEPLSRPRSVAVHRKKTRPLSGLGLVVDPARTRLVRVAARDCWSSPTEDGRYFPTRLGGWQGRTWGVAAVMSRSAREEYAEAIVERPTYVAIVAAGASAEAIQLAQRVTGLPVVGWDDLRKEVWRRGGEERGGAPRTAPTWGTWQVIPQPPSGGRFVSRRTGRPATTRELVVAVGGVPFLRILPSDKQDVLYYVESVLLPGERLPVWEDWRKRKSFFFVLPNGRVEALVLRFEDQRVKAVAEYIRRELEGIGVNAPVEVLEGEEAEARLRALKASYDVVMGKEVVAEVRYSANGKIFVAAGGRVYRPGDVAEVMSVPVTVPAHPHPLSVAVGIILAVVKERGYLMSTAVRRKK